MSGIIQATNLQVDNIKHSGGTTGLTIDSNGYVVMSARPAFQATGNAGGWVTISNSQYNVFEFDNVVLNQGSHYSSTNDRFTAPVTGLYSFHMSLYGRLNAGQGDNTNYWGATFLKNGSNAMQYNSIMGYQNAGDYDSSFSQNVILSLSATDYIQVQARSWGTANGEIFSNNSHFSGYFIG